MVALRLCGQTDPPAAVSTPPIADDPKTILPSSLNAPQSAPNEVGLTPLVGNGILPAPRASAVHMVGSEQNGVDWNGLYRASGRFLALEHGFRLLTEPGTRSGLGGNFFGSYGSAIGNLHGWADGD